MPAKSSSRDNRSKGWVRRLNHTQVKAPTRINIKLTEPEAGVLSALAMETNMTPAAYLRSYLNRVANRRLPKELVQALYSMELNDA